MDLLNGLEKKSVDVMYKKRMENRFRSGLLSAGSVADLLADERPQTCLLCLSPLIGTCAVHILGCYLKWRNKFIWLVKQYEVENSYITTEFSHAYDYLLDAKADRCIKTRKNRVPASSDEDLVMRSKRQNKVSKFWLRYMNSLLHII